MTGDVPEAMPPTLARRTRCPVCASSDGSVVADEPLGADPIARYLRDFYRGRLDPGEVAGGRFVLVCCGDCGLLYQRDVPTGRLLTALYDAVAVADPDEVARSRGLAVRQAYAHDIELAIAHLDAPVGTLAVLDHGAGTGLWLAMAAAYGCRTAGTELSPAGRDRLRTLGHDAFDPAELPADHVDFVNSEQVFEHLVEPAAEMAALVRALRPGGLLRVSVPNGTGVEQRLAAGDWGAPKGSAGSLNAVAPLEHLNCFDATALSRLATDAGLTPFRYPLRRFLHPMMRIRFAATSLLHRVRRPVGTLQYFQKPATARGDGEPR